MLKRIANQVKKDLNAKLAKGPLPKKKKETWWDRLDDTSRSPILSYIAGGCGRDKRARKCFERLESAEKWGEKESRDAEKLLRLNSDYADELIPKLVPLILERTQNSPSSVEALMAASVFSDSVMMASALRKAVDMFRELSLKQRAEIEVWLLKKLPEVVSSINTNVYSGRTAMIFAVFLENAFKDREPSIPSMPKEEAALHEDLIDMMLILVDEELNKDKELRLGAARALWELNHSDKDFWKNRLADPAVSTFLIEKIFEMPQETTDEDYTSGWDMLRQNLHLDHVLKAVLEQGPRSFPFLIDSVQSGNVSYRVSALKALHHFSEIPKAALTAVEICVSSQNEQEFELASRLLMRHKETKVLSTVLPMRLEESNGIKSMASEMLAECVKKKMVPREKMPTVLYSVQRSLAGLKKAQSAENLVFILVSQGDYYTLNFIGKMMTEKAEMDYGDKILEGLRLYLSSKSSKKSIPVLEKSINEISSYLHDKERQTRTNALIVLAKMSKLGSSRARGKLRSICSEMERKMDMGDLENQVVAVNTLAILHAHEFKPATKALKDTVIPEIKDMLTEDSEDPREVILVGKKLTAVLLSHIPKADVEFKDLLKTRLHIGANGRLKEARVRLNEEKEFFELSIEDIAGLVSKSIRTVELRRQDEENQFPEFEPEGEPMMMEPIEISIDAGDELERYRRFMEGNLKEKEQ